MSTNFTGFAVFDLETTGLSVGRHDRIVEIGVVRLDEDLDVVEEWETLINPDRDIGAQDVHGITASDLRDAPTFAELLADIWHRFEGTIPVAHNFTFDRRFMLAEFDRAGIDVGCFDGLCTMRLSNRLGLAANCRKLVDVCHCLSIPVKDAHSAGMDAKMCAAVLQRVGDPLKYAGGLEPLSCPTLWKKAPTPLGITRQKARETPVQSPLQILASRLNSAALGGSADDASVNEYLLVLDHVLEDRVIEEAEIDALSACATDCGLSLDQVDGIHEKYVSNLVALVLSDGIVTDDEQRDLYRVADLLGVSRETVDASLSQGGAEERYPLEDLSGKSVCFTGTSQCKIDGETLSRSELEAMAENSGLTIKKNVSKKLDILVLADPDSASGKAKKAREYGIRIMAERAFWRKLGIAAG